MSAFRPGLILAASLLAAAPAAAEIAVLDNGQTLKVTGQRHADGLVYLALKGGGEVGLPPEMVRGLVPDEVIEISNGIQRFEGPGRYAKDMDLDVFKPLISTMAAKGIYHDPTMVAFESLYVPENGEMSPSYAAFVGTLPPTIERGFRLGGFQVPEGLTRADYRKSWARMVQLLGKMHEAGVPIVAGTDGAGIELVHELEIYLDAGFTPAEAIAAATIVPARLVGQDKTTGSIKEGKVADLVLVEGDPSKRMGDLRQTRVVMLAGKMLDADALRTAAGFSGRPKTVN